MGNGGAELSNFPMVNILERLANTRNSEWFWWWLATPVF
jgi:hypothetical protein